MEGFVLITGISAAGKSTVAQLLAERLPRAVHVRGDVFRRFVVSGRAETSPDAPEEALAQLWLRYRLSAYVGDEYVAAGFTAVVQDIVIGEYLKRYLGLIRSRPLRLVVLDPAPDVFVAREAGRAKTAYDDGWTVESLHALHQRETPRRGLWLDNGGLTPSETVDAILARADEALIV